MKLNAEDTRHSLGDDGSAQWVIVRQMGKTQVHEPTHTTSAEEWVLPGN